MSSNIISKRAELLSTPLGGGVLFTFQIEAASSENIDIIADKPIESYISYDKVTFKPQTLPTIVENNTNDRLTLQIRVIASEPNTQIYKSDNAKAIIGPCIRIEGNGENFSKIHCAYCKQIGFMVKNTHNFTNTDAMFKSCELVLIQDFDTSNVTSMNEMFRDIKKGFTFPKGFVLNTSKVTSMSYMFSGTNFIYHRNGIFLDTSNVLNMDYMFMQAMNLITIEKLDTSKVTSMTFMFSASSITHIPDLDVGNVLNMGYMFANCKYLRAKPNLNTNGHCVIVGMYQGCTSLQ